MKKLLIVLLVAVTQGSLAQPTEGPKTLIKSGHRGGFGELSLHSTGFNDDILLIGGLRGGWIFSRALAVGFESRGFLPTASLDDVYRNHRVMPVGGFGGLFLEGIVFSNRSIHVTFPVGMGVGWIGYRHDVRDLHSNFDFDVDVEVDFDADLDDIWVSHGSYVDFTYDSPIHDQDLFWYVEPGINLELNIIENIRFCYGISRRITSDLSLDNTSLNELERLNMNVAFKFGVF